MQKGIITPVIVAFVVMQLFFAGTWVERSLATESLCPPQGSSSGRLRIHAVEQGEDVKNIAEMWGVDVIDLEKENNLLDDRLIVGQRLRIPGTVQPSSSSAGEESNVARPFFLPILGLALVIILVLAVWMLARRNEGGRCGKSTESE